MKNVLVIGGAGYIGSHMVKLLIKEGYQVLVLDDLSSGHADAVLGSDLFQGDYGDPKILDQVFKIKFDAIMHFSSSIQVGESILNPAKYYKNNFINTYNLLLKMQEYKINKIIFSSSAAIFGEPEYTPIDELHPKKPVNPYGRTKLMVEQLLADFDKAYGLKFINLRYFNASGADPECELGERHDPETHLIPLILQVASGKKPFISVFGNDYPTKDGTCVRDYIHIQDLCVAHLLALELLLNNVESNSFNLGNGNGFSVLEVIKTVEEISNKKIAIKFEKRREGDPSILVADPTFAFKKLGWKPKYSDLNNIVKHAWEWEKKIN